ncbi:MAG: ADP-ribosylglycohydrolase family protein [Candidatus Aenigmarchaeota archaeon]|nr:ADP-ribosylglycohydrolase family protein [Candidatus Aenigmarchaeota archaeon]
MKKDCILSGLIGLCVGDALGVPVEFKSRDELSKNPVESMIGNGTYNQLAGTWSDDSSLTFCLAESLCTGYDLNDLSLKFCRWLNEGYWTPYGKVFDVGISTKKAIQNLCNGKEPTRSGGNKEQDNGNGSLMRILPIAFFTNDMYVSTMVKVVEEVSSLTHRHNRSIIACSAYVFIANNIIRGKNKKEAFRLLRLNLPFLFSKEKGEEYNNELKHFKRILDKDFFNLPAEKINSSGYVIDTLEAAFWCFMNNDNYKDTVLSAVNLGEDTDTVAAIAGGLAGIYYGINNIPKEWIDAIARKKEIIYLAKKLDESLKKRWSYIGFELLDRINIKKPSKHIIKQNYEKYIKDCENEVRGVLQFSAYSFGYPESDHAVVDAGEVNRQVWRYYHANKKFDIFSLGHLCTAVFFISRARHHQGSYPKKPEEGEVAISKEIVRRIHQLL